MDNNKSTEKKEKEILLMGNGTRVEVSHWEKDNKSFYGRVLDVNPPIFVFAPVSYLAANIKRTYKKKRS